MKVYILMNESIFAAYPDVCIVEVVQVYSSMNLASEELSRLARDYNVEMEPGGTSVYLPPSKTILVDEYYIQEWEVK